MVPDLRSSVVGRVLGRLEARVVETLLGKPKVAQLQPGALRLGAVEQVLRLEVPASRVLVADGWCSVNELCRTAFCFCFLAYVRYLMDLG